MDFTLIHYMLLTWYSQLWFLGQLLLVIMVLAFAVRWSIGGIYEDRTRAAAKFFITRKEVDRGKEEPAENTEDYTNPLKYTRQS